MITRLADNQNPTTWTIWGIMTGTFLLIIIAAIIYFIYYYKKNDKKFLTVNKIAYMSIFLTFFIIQAYIFAPFIRIPVPFSFNSIWVIAVAFLFGPLEGMIFGWVADTLGVVINGYSYELLPSLIYPMIALIAGITGIIYFSDKGVSKNQAIIMFQSVIILLFVLLVPSMIYLSHNWDAIVNNKAYGGPYSGPGIEVIMSIVITSFVVMGLIMEGLFFWYLKSEDKRGDLILFAVLCISALAERGTSLIIRPFSQFFAGYESIYTISLLTRIMSTTYLVPTVALTSFAVVKYSQMAINIK